MALNCLWTAARRRSKKPDCAHQNEEIRHSVVSMKLRGESRSMQ